MGLDERFQFDKLEEIQPGMDEEVESELDRELSSDEEAQDKEGR